MKFIQLANGKQIPLVEYVRGIKKVKENPEKTFQYGLCGWWPEKGKVIRRDFFEMIRDHCNRGLAMSPKIKEQVILKAWKGGRKVACKACKDKFVRHNLFNDSERYCPECRKF